MAVRIETKEIPAHVIKTNVILIYGPEYERAQRLRTFCLIGSAISLFGGMLGVIPVIIKNPPFDMNSNLGLLTIAACSIIITGLTFFFLFIHKRIFEKLLKKNGWDGEPNYRIELEYQTFLHE